MYHECHCTAPRMLSETAAEADDAGSAASAAAAAAAAAALPLLLHPAYMSLVPRLGLQRFSTYARQASYDGFKDICMQKCVYIYICQYIQIYLFAHIHT